MTLHTVPPHAPPRPARRRSSGRRLEQRRRRRRLASQDRAAARLAELHTIRSLVATAGAVVGAGWVQHGWFCSLDESGTARLVDGPRVAELAERPVVAACLVGGVVHAAGGPAVVASQSVQRALDLVWHALHRDERDPVAWCPAPSVRTAQVRDLTRWNDSPRRTADDVVALLRQAERVADGEIARARAVVLAPRT